MNGKRNCLFLRALILVLLLLVLMSVKGKAQDQRITLKPFLGSKWAAPDTRTDRWRILVNTGGFEQPRVPKAQRSESRLVNRGQQDLVPTFREFYTSLWADEGQLLRWTDDGWDQVVLSWESRGEPWRSAIQRVDPKTLRVQVERSAFLVPNGLYYGSWAWDGLNISVMVVYVSSASDGTHRLVRQYNHEVVDGFHRALVLRTGLPDPR